MGTNAEVSRMGCLISVLARIALLAVWIWTPLVSRAFQDGLLLPVLGILFLPLTCLVYVFVYVPGIGVSGWSWFWVALALLLDVGIHVSATYDYRNRIPRYGAREH
jgi:hypothetical protein